MKKITSLLLALSMIIAISLTLSSCELISELASEGKEDVITVEDGYLVVNGVKTEYKVLVEEESDNNDSNDNDTEGGDQIADTTTRYTITEAEWKALETNDKNYTMTQTLTHKAVNPETGEVLTDPETGSLMIAIQTENYIYTENAVSNSVFIESMGETAEYFYFYILHNGDWYELNSETAVANKITDNPSSDFFDSMIASFSYSDLVYNEEDNSYCAVLNDTPFYFWFKNGNLVKIQPLIKMDTEDYIITREICFTNIGTSSLEIPECTFAE